MAHSVSTLHLREPVCTQSYDRVPTGQFAPSSFSIKFHWTSINEINADWILLKSLSVIWKLMELRMELRSDLTRNSAAVMETIDFSLGQIVARYFFGIAFLLWMALAFTLSFLFRRSKLTENFFKRRRKPTPTDSSTYKNTTVTLAPNFHVIYGMKNECLPPRLAAVFDCTTEEFKSCNSISYLSFIPFPVN